jgi:alpha-beta hydrolase superfamily lysophospholipase
MLDEKVKHQEFRLTNKDGLQIYSQAWFPQANAKANLIIAHGLGEHSGRYQHMAAYFVEKEYAVFALDHQGHGKSDGKRGHVNSFSDYIIDLEQFRNKVAELSPNKPTFLFGHSMGALIVLLYVLDYQDLVQAAVVSAPPIRIKMGPPTFVKELVPKVANVSPTFTIKSGLKAEWVSRDQAIVDRYKTDPLNHPHISMSLFSGMYNGGKQAFEDADKITLPLLMLYGSQDKIIDSDMVHNTFEKISSDNKELHVFENDFHEVHNEADKLDEFGTIWQWLEKL